MYLPLLLPTRCPTSTGFWSRFLENVLDQRNTFRNLPAFLKLRSMGTQWRRKADDAGWPRCCRGWWGRLWKLNLKKGSTGYFTFEALYTDRTFTKVNKCKIYAKACIYLFFKPSGEIEKTDETHQHPPLSSWLRWRENFRSWRESRRRNGNRHVSAGSC